MSARSFAITLLVLLAIACGPPTPQQVETLPFQPIPVLAPFDGQTYPSICQNQQVYQVLKRGAGNVGHSYERGGQTYWIPAYPPNSIAEFIETHPDTVILSIVQVGGQHAWPDLFITYCVRKVADD